MEQFLSPARKIVDLYIHKDGTRYFRISWRDTWEPESHLVECDSLLQHFWKEYEEDQVLKKNEPNEKDNKLLPDSCQCGALPSSRKLFITKSTQCSEKLASRQSDQGVQVSFSICKKRNKGVQCVPRTANSATQHCRDTLSHASVGTDNIADEILLRGELVHDQPLEFSASVVDDSMTTEKGVLNSSSSRMKEMIFVTDAPLSLEGSPKTQQPPPGPQQHEVGQKLDDAPSCLTKRPVVFPSSISFSMENSKVMLPSQSTPIASPVLQEVSRNATVCGVLSNNSPLTPGVVSEGEKVASRNFASSGKCEAPLVCTAEIAVPPSNKPYVVENIHAGLEVTDPTDILCPAYKPTTISTPSLSSSSCPLAQPVKKRQNKRKRCHEKNIFEDCIEKSPMTSKKTRKRNVFSDVNVCPSDTIPPTSSDEIGSGLQLPKQKSEQHENALMSPVSSIETSVTGGAYVGSSIVRNIPTFLPNGSRVSEENNINDAFISKYWR